MTIESSHTQTHRKLSQATIIPHIDVSSTMLDEFGHRFRVPIFTRDGQLHLNFACGSVVDIHDDGKQTPKITSDDGVDVCVDDY
jgi:hypothetical protein